MSKQLFNARKKFFQDKKAQHSSAQIAKGRNPNKSVKLFSVTTLEHSDGVSRGGEELAELTKLEFQRRWAAVPDDIPLPWLNDDQEETDLPLTIVELWSAARLLKRPWICDCRGIPPAALLAAPHFLTAALAS